MEVTKHSLISDCCLNYEARAGSWSRKSSEAVLLQAGTSKQNMTSQFLVVRSGDLIPASGFWLHAMLVGPLASNSDQQLLTVHPKTVVSIYVMKEKCIALRFPIFTLCIFDWLLEESCTSCPHHFQLAG